MWVSYLVKFQLWLYWVDTLVYGHDFFFLPENCWEYNGKSNVLTRLPTLVEIKLQTFPCLWWVTADSWTWIFHLIFVVPSLRFWTLAYFSSVCKILWELLCIFWSSYSVVPVILIFSPSNSSSPHCSPKFYLWHLKKHVSCNRY